MPSTHWLATVARSAGLPRSNLLTLEPELPGPKAWVEASTQIGADERVLVQPVARYFKLEVADLRGADPAALAMLPARTARRYGVFPLRVDYTTLVVATSDPTDTDAEQAVRFASGRRPLFEIAAPSDIARAQDASYGARGPVLGDAAGPALAAPAPRPAAPESAPPSPAEGGAAPPAPAPREPEPAGARAVVADEAPSRPYVLVVDDDPESRFLARAILLKEGYRIAEARDGNEALDVLRAGALVDLVLADLLMPEMDGRRLLAAIRADERLSRLPVVILTGSRNVADELHLLRDGADDFIRKPIDPPIFTARIASVVRRASM